MLTAVEYPEDRVVVTFKDAMLRTQTVESNVLALVETLLSSYVDDTDYDIESLIFVLNGECELREADYALTLRDVSSPRIQVQGYDGLTYCSVASRTVT